MKVESSTRTNDNLVQIKKDIMISEVTASASSSFGLFGIYPFCTYSISKAQGSYIDESDVSYQSSTSNNKIVELGTEIGFNIKSLDLRLGGIYEFSSYSFLSNDNSIMGNPQTNNNRLTGYLGINVNARNDIFLSAAYALISENNKTSYTYDSENE
jgi:hypothetical protein